MEGECYFRCCHSFQKGPHSTDRAVPYVTCQSSQSCLILAYLLLHIRQCLQGSRPILLCHIDSILRGCVYGVLYVRLLPALGWRGTYRAAHTHVLRPQALYLGMIHSDAPAGATLVSWSSPFSGQDYRSRRTGTPPCLAHSHSRKRPIDKNKQA